MQYICLSEGQPFAKPIVDFNFALYISTLIKREKTFQMRLKFTHNPHTHCVSECAARPALKRILPSLMLSVNTIDGRSTGIRPGQGVSISISVISTSQRSDPDHLPYLNNTFRFLIRIRIIKNELKIVVPNDNPSSLRQPPSPAIACNNDIGSRCIGIR